MRHSIMSMDSSIAKVLKQFESLKASKAKLVEENQKLKTQLAEYKSTNSRIRRVPQKKTADTKEQQAPAVEPVAQTVAA